MLRFHPLTLAGVIQDYAERLPNFEVLTVEGATVCPDEKRTYSSLWNNALALAAGLQLRGCQRGDRLATLLVNHPEFVDLMVACSLLGLVLVPIDPRTKGEKLLYLLNSVQVRWVVAGDYATVSLCDLRGHLNNLTAVFCLYSGEVGSVEGQFSAMGFLNYSDLPVADDYTKYGFVGCDTDDTFELIFTSGTTGDPKGIVMTHRRYVESSKMMPSVFGYLPDDRLYSGLSLTHANAQVITLGAALMNALPCVLSRRFSKSRLWDITRQYQCTTFTLLGGMITAVYADTPKANDADNPVRMVVSAGMPAEIWTEFENRFDLKVFEFYGAAEGGLVMNPAEVGPVGSIGRPVPSLEYRIVDDEGCDVRANQNSERVGEILFRHADGSPFRVTYFNNPSASEKKCAGGWLHMGDVVREDRDGWLYFLFRKGGGIRRNGEFINTVFIEKVIAQAPEIDDVFVYGVSARSGVPGEKDVVAAVVLNPNRDFDVQRLFRRCRQHLEPNFVPTIIQVIEQIPKTASEKPQERFLIQAMEDNPKCCNFEQR